MNPRFPAPYVYQEYPKMLYHPVDNSQHIVMSSEEEDYLVASWGDEDKPEQPERRKPGRPRKNP